MTKNTSLPEDLDAYFESHLLPSDAALEAADHRSQQVGLVPHAVSPLQGAFLQILAKAVSARRILEIGTLGGYSTIWLARALPADGTLVSLEISEANRAVALENISDAGLSHLVDIRLGAAADLLQAMIASGEPSYDFIFIDADKRSNPIYWESALKLSHKGTMIIVDNVVRNGAILDDETTDPDVIGVQDLLDLMSKSTGITATALQTVGSKGHDGFAIAMVD